MEIKSLKRNKFKKKVRELSWETGIDIKINYAKITHSVYINVDGIILRVSDHYRAKSNYHFNFIVNHRHKMDDIICSINNIIAIPKDQKHLIMYTTL
jgi:hypothetical protein